MDHRLSAEKKMNSIWTCFEFLLLCILFIFVTGCGDKSKLPGADEDEKPKAWTLKEQIAELSGKDETLKIPAIELKSDTIRDTLSVTGELVPVESIIVRPLMEGKLEFVRKLKVGDNVAKDELIARIDDRDIEDLIANQEKQIELTQKDLDLNKEELDQTKRSLEFDRKLLEEGFLNKSEFEKSELAFKKAVIALERSEIQLEQEKRKLRQEIRKREKVAIIAPISGMVAPVSHLKNESGGASLISEEIMGNDGKQVSASTELFGLISQEGFLARCLVNGKDKARLQKGMNVNTTIYSFKSIQAKGSIRKISLLQDTQSHAYKIWIELQRQDPNFASGLFVRGAIELARHDNAIVIDQKFLKEENGQEFIQVVKEGKIKNRNVETGLKSGEKVELVSGAEEGELLVAAPEVYAVDQNVEPVIVKVEEME